MNSVVLDQWYAAHARIRRLWAVSESERLRVIVMLEPTRDGDDIYPVWLANGEAWMHDLQSRLDGPVELEVIGEPLAAEFDGVLIADLSWRDASAA